MGAISDWRSFWDNAHSIYVNARHKDVHYRDIADADRRPSCRGRARACSTSAAGEALHADRVAEVAAEVLLCDSAPSVRAAMAARFAGNPRIKVISPEEVEKLPDRSLDLIVANSVVQYLTAAELERLLVLWRRLLADGGALIVADVIPPDVGAVERRRCAVALCRAPRLSRGGADRARAHGRLALSQVAQPARDRAIHRSRVHGEAHRGRLHRRTAGARNMEHNPARMSFRARPKQGKPHRKRGHADGQPRHARAQLARRHPPPALAAPPPPPPALGSKGRPRSGAAW